MDFCCFCLSMSISPSFTISAQIFSWGAISSPELRPCALNRACFTPGSKDGSVIYAFLIRVLCSSDQGDWRRNGHQSQYRWINDSVLISFFLEQIGILFTLDMNLTGCKTWVLKTSSASSEAEMRWRAAMFFELLKSIELKTRLFNYVI